MAEPKTTRALDEWGLLPKRSRRRWEITKKQARAVIVKLATRLDKEPEELEPQDLLRAGLYVIVRKFHPAGRHDVEGFLKGLGFKPVLGKWRKYNGWTDRKDRVRAMRYLIEQVKRYGPGEGRKARRLRMIGMKDFQDHGLLTLYERYVGADVRKMYPAGHYILSLKSPVSRALVDTGFVKKGSVLERALEKRADRTRYMKEDPETVREVIVRAVRRSGKEPRTITYKDLVRNGAGTPLINLFRRDYFRALRFAGYHVDADNHIGRKKRNFWTDKKNRVKAIRRLVEERGGPERITQTDLRKAGLQSLLQLRPRLFDLIKEAGYRIEGWELAGQVPNHFYKEPENRKRALRWLAKKNRKKVSNLTIQDLKEHGFSGLLDVYTRKHVLDQPHPGRLSSKAPLIKRILVRDGFLKGDGLYGGAILKGDGRRKAKGYERHWVPRKESRVRTNMRTGTGSKVKGRRNGSGIWKVSRDKGSIKIRNF